MILVTIPFLLIGNAAWFNNGSMLEFKVSIVGMTLTIISVLLVGTYIDKRKLSDFGVLLRNKRWWLDYLFGVLSGIAGPAVYVLVLRMRNLAVIEPALKYSGTLKDIVFGLLLSLLTYIGVGVFEELMRVYQIRNLAEGFSNKGKHLGMVLIAAAILPAIYSVVMHVYNPDPNFLAFIFITTFIYGMYYLWTGRSGLAMGFHFAWDFAVSSIFLLSGGASPAQPAIFSVLLNTSAPNAMRAVILLGILGKLGGLAVVLLWLKLRDGKVNLNPLLTTPNLKP